jgi:hypothetical protein
VVEATAGQEQMALMAQLTQAVAAVELEMEVRAAQAVQVSLS